MTSLSLYTSMYWLQPLRGAVRVIGRLEGITIGRFVVEGVCVWEGCPSLTTIVIPRLLREDDGVLSLIVRRLQRQQSGYALYQL